MMIIFNHQAVISTQAAFDFPNKSSRSALFRHPFLKQDINLLMPSIASRKSMSRPVSKFAEWLARASIQDKFGLCGLLALVC